MYSKLKYFFYDLVTPSKKGQLGYYFDIFIICLISLSVVDIVLESEPSLKSKYNNYFYQFERITVFIFSLEYLIRLWTITENPKFKKRFEGRIKFIFTPLAVIDLIAILPFFLPFIGVDMRFLRIFRLFRVFRLFKMARYSNAFDLVRRVLFNKKEELIITFFFMSIILIIVSTLMYYAERDVQPEYFSSISKSLWWGVITLTTVGYGDAVPMTSLGKILNGIIALIGIGIIALPSGIIASGYTEEIIKLKNKS